MKYTILTLLLFCTAFLAAQSTNLLVNGSFEDENPGHSIVPERWMNCGFPGESPPDVLFAGDDNPFGVKHKAFAGQSYLQLVTRDNGTFESVGQELATPLERGKTYRVTARLAISLSMHSRSRTTNREMAYDCPIKVSFAGGDELCNRDNQLHLTDRIDAEAWTPVSFTFTAKQDMPYFFLTAVNDSPGGIPGNVLVDDVTLVEVE